MLDLGFLEDVERILALTPNSRQTALFSATMPPAIRKLADRYLYDPVTIKVKTQTLTVDTVEQFQLEVKPADKADRLVEVLGAERPEQAIVFVRTKIRTDQLHRKLRDRGLNVKALHGDLTQGQRDGVMLQFKDHRLRLLVATDVAARGLDIEHVTHVINYDVPDVSDSYVHRIGRTGRVGRTGRAITFVSPVQRREVERIEREVRTRIGEWEPPEDRLEHAPRPRRREHALARRPRPPRGPEPEHVKLFLNRGQRSGIDADDVRWALVEGAVIPPEAIGDIRVLERFSFVDLDAAHAEQALERLDGTKLEGKQIRLEYARG
jgi:ATP-dependent RNA helicase DeaD